MAHDESYEIQPARIGRSSPRRAFGVVALVAAFVGLAIAKPWAGPIGPAVVQPAPSSASATRPTSAPIPSVALIAQPAAAPAPAEPDWPVDLSHTVPTDGSSPGAGDVLASLATHSGSWGVGNAGTGPRLLRDEPWSDWAAVVPEASSAAPDRIAKWPGTSLCAGYPTIYDHPSLVAVTAPPDLAPYWRVVGWWTDGGRVASLAGSVRQVTPTGVGGISYLERVDRAPWPAGRYEFHVIAGDRILALTVCLTRRG